MSASSPCSAAGYKVVLINSNPATIMTDPSTADRTYVCPMIPELLEPIIAKVRACVCAQLTASHANECPGAVTGPHLPPLCAGL